MTATIPRSSSATLGRYRDRLGRPRQLLARPSAGGSVLVIDRHAIAHGEERLVAHLEADEPLENAVLVAGLYLADERGRWCRRLLASDAQRPPLESPESLDTLGEHVGEHTELIDAEGSVCRLALLSCGMSIPQLRWCRCGPSPTPEPIRVRDVIGRMQSYEPARAITERAVARHRLDPDVSVATLAAELARVHSSRIVLNRGLRERALALIAREGVSMSEIAMRCGRAKRDARGVLSGETSWLARRLGLLPEGGQRVPTPWVHTDVLALIARQGLGVSPREVELA
ncbi:MAG: hypothetical protein FWD42_00050 [Solirubrobacterales bacterium]|nr:hypothetical protein [Solirubrobacterales bacterium]